MKPFVTLIVALFGRLQWSPPGWARWLGRHRLASLLLLAAVGGGAWGYHYYRALPQPLQVVAEAEPPGLSEVSGEELRIQPLRITFAYDPESGEGEPPAGSPSAARIDLADRPLADGVTLSPALPGRWAWEGDDTLRFEPEREWPPGSDYRVTLDPKLFNPELRFRSLELGFTTPPFTAELERFRFHLDPREPTRRQVVATLNFSHGVDPASLASHLRLLMRPSGAGPESAPEGYRYDYELASFGRVAHLRSEPLELPEKSNFMRLELAAGVAAAAGGRPTGEAVEGRVEIPDRYGFFRVESALAQIVRNGDDQPEQVVTLAFTDEVEAQLLAGRVQAWLLPRHPKRRNWGAAEVDAALLARAEPVALEPIPNERDAAKLYNYRFDTEPGRDLFLQLPGGLTSVGRFVMAKGYRTVLESPEYPRELKISHPGALLSRAGEHRIGLVSRGLEAVRVRVARVLEHQLHHLVSQAGGDFSQPRFYNYQFNLENIASGEAAILPLRQGHPKEANHSAFDLSRYLPQGPGYGLFVIEVQGWEPRHKRVTGPSEQRLILISDLGLIAKRNADDGIDLFVQSLADGNPVAGARVDLLGKNGEPIRSATSDADGHARLEPVRGFQNEHWPTAYLVRHGDDASFLPYDQYGRQLNLSRYDVGGYQSRYEKPDALSAYLFSDRGIYRPGEEVRLGAVVRRMDFGVTPGLPLELVVRNPRGSEVLKRKLSLPELGLVAERFATGATGETGNYVASLHLVRANGRRDDLLGSTEFRVEEFQPDRLRIRSHLLEAPARGWSAAGRLTAEVSLQNLFGTPAQGRKVTAELTVEPAAFHFPEYRDYRFDDPLAAPGAPRVHIREALPDAATDADGMARFELPLERFTGGTYRLSLRVQGFEADGGRGVSTASATLLSPLPRLVGYKADGELGYIHQDGERNLEFIAVDPALATVAVEGLTLRLIERRPLSTLMRQEDGTYAYQTVIKEELRAESPYAIPAGGSRYRLPTAEAGDFVLELVEGDGPALSRVAYSVVGQANLAGRLEKNAELRLRLDKGDYRPGETIELAVTAPYTGSGLITIESDRVHAYRWFRADTNATLQRIELPEGLEGNAYVQVAFMRAPDSPEIHTSPLSYAVAPFTIDRSRRRVELGLELPERARPGEPLTIRYRASRPGKVVLMAVDEGILQVARHATPQPLDHFLRKRALEVTTSQIIDQILPEYRLIRERAAAGGGMADEALARNLNPFARKAPEAVAFWSGVLEAGPEPRDYTVELPAAFNGELRVMAVAVADEALGSAEQRLTVRGPFVLSPNVLTMAAPGDEFQVSVAVANLVEGSGPEAEVEVTLELDGPLEAVGESAARLVVPEGGEGLARFRLRAADAPGAAELRFAAHIGEERGRAAASLSVRPLLPYRTTVESGRSGDGRVELTGLRRLRPELARQEIGASASPLLLVGGLSAYLRGYPHGCTEQLVSQVFPAVGLALHPGFAESRPAVRERVMQLTGQLRSRQTADGGFSLWPGGSEAARFPSVYAMHFLLDAREEGFPIPSDLFEHGLGYLERLAREEGDDLEQARVRAAAIYLLTRGGQVTTNALVDLHEGLKRHHPEAWQGDLAAVYMAATYRLLKMEAQARELVRGYRPGGGREAGWSDFHSPLTRDAQYLYLLAGHFPERLEAVEEEAIAALLEPLRERRYNTIASSYTILALGAYSRARLGETGEERIAIYAGGGEARSPLATEPHPFVHAAFDTAVAALEVAGPESGSRSPPLYYQLSQAGFDREPPAEPLRDGLEVRRVFLDGDGNEVTEVRQGQELTVRLSFRSLGGPLTNVALIDLLPGGFELDRESLRDGLDGWQADYVDLREDRAVLYGSVGSGLTRVEYKVKATAAGRFRVPPPYAEAMYRQELRAQGVAGRIEVTAAE